VVKVRCLSTYILSGLADINELELTSLTRIQAYFSIYVKYESLWCRNMQNYNQLRPTVKSFALFRGNASLQVLTLFGVLEKLQKNV